MTADQAGEPGHCCVPGCGVPSPRCLCPDCYARYVLPDGTLPGWLAELQRDAKRTTERQRRNQRRSAAGQGGVTFVPLSAIE